MSNDLPNFHSFAFWGKSVVQLVMLYNAFYHKNLDPKLAAELVTSLEAAYHGVYGLVQSAHALKDGFVQSSGAGTDPGPIIPTSPSPAPAITHP